MFIFAYNIDPRVRKDDLEILLRLKKGDENAFTLLYNRYAGKSFNFVFALVKDESVAQDIVQDTFVKLYLKRSELSEIESFNSYIFRMLKNSVLDFFTAETVHRKHLARMSAAEDEISELTQERIHSAELEKIIRKVVSSMPVQRRNVFILSRVKGVSNTEIALEFGISIRTVENHLSNAMRDIRKAISLI